MRRLVLSLDGVPYLRETTLSRHLDLPAAAALAELAGVNALRLSVNEELRPVREEDVRSLRGAAHDFELRMPPSQSLLKVALEGRPDRAVLAAEGRQGEARSGPLDLRARGGSLEPLVRALAEAGIASVAVIAPDLEAVKRAHGLGVPAVEFHTGAIVDLPASERRGELERLGDAVRLAAKLRLAIGLAGGLGYRRLPEVLESSPAAEWVVVGRAFLARSLLVGMDRAARDLRELLA
jgi:pyridoxine 5-phosphate synthase